MFVCFFFDQEWKIKIFNIFPIYDLAYPRGKKFQKKHFIAFLSTFDSNHKKKFDLNLLQL